MWTPLQVGPPFVHVRPSSGPQAADVDAPARLPIPHLLAGAAAAETSVQLVHPAAADPAAVPVPEAMSPIMRTRMVPSR